MSLFSESLSYFAPIDYPPQGIQMGSALVLVVEVVGMFPDVESEERLEGTIQLGMTSV